MQVSILVPSYNQKESLQLLVASFENQTFPKSDFELIIADDGSTDSTRELVSQYRGTLNLKFVQNQTHLGRAQARNSAIRKAQGQYVIFLDGDMSVEPQFIEEHLAAHSTRSDAVFMGKMIPSPLLQNDLLSWYRITRGAQKAKPEAPLPARYFATGNSSLSMQLLKKAGFFNEEYQCWGGEDLEMGYQLESAGASFFVLDKALSYHHHRESLDGHLIKITQYAQSGLKLLIKKRPTHASSGYLRLFTSKNLLTGFLLNILFFRLWFYPIRGLAGRALCRTINFRLFDYLTYYRIYHGLKRS